MSEGRSESEAASDQWKPENNAAAQALYQELRKLAQKYMSLEKPGQTLQATALVHEAYLRLAGGANSAQWNSEGHFFAAAAVAMRRILVESARRKNSLKRGGAGLRVNFDENQFEAGAVRENLIELDDALQRLEEINPQAAQIVNLVYFAGLSQREAATILDLSERTAGRLWAYARAWLRNELDVREIS